MKKIKLLTAIYVFLCFLFGVTTNAQVYTCDFEDDNENAKWVLNPGNFADKLLNRWYIDKAVNNGGKKSLYISADGGKTAGYVTQTGNSVVAYRVMTLPKGKYEVSFDWQAFGWNSDALYALWMPSSVSSNVTLTSALPSYITKTNYPIAMNDSVRMYGRAWNSMSGVIESDGVTEYKLVFVWNNGVVQAVPPAGCVDNINIIPLGACDKPTDIEIEPTPTGVAIKWNGSADSYEVKCKSDDDDTWHELTVTEENATIDGLGEGICNVFIRSKCGDTYSAWVSSSKFIFFPGTRCIDYMDLESAYCFFGKTSNPKSNQGVVDYGYASPNSRHTIHYSRLETDPRTNGKLKTVPDGEIASIRLGNWLTGAEAETIEYDFHVDSTENAILLLKYSVVLQDPGHTPAEQQPRFTLNVLNNGMPLDEWGCAEASFAAGFDTEGWHQAAGDPNTSPPLWKDWTIVGINLRDYHAQDLTIRLTTYDCIPAGHYGYAYFALACNDGKILGLSCGESAKNEFKAPDGFKYRWYLPNNPGKTLSEDQVYSVDPTDTLTYYCDVIQPTKAECYYTVKANATPRYPVAKCGYNARIENCQNIVSFTDSSYIRHQNPITGEETVGEGKCDSISWDFGDGTTISNDPIPDHIFPEKGGKFKVIMTAHLSECTDVREYEIELPDLSLVIDTTYVTICDGDSCEFNGKKYYEEGCYSDTLAKDENGCPSIKTLNLTVALPDTVELYDTICSNDVPYSFNEIQLTESGDYYDTLVNHLKCDSLVILHLLINESLNIDIEQNIQACADDDSIQIPFTVQSGLVTTYDVSFEDEEINNLLAVKDAKPIGSNVIIYLNDKVVPNKYVANVIFKNMDCGDVSAAVTLNINYPDTIITQRWNDVLGVRRSDFNGGYDFVAFQWYKNNEPIPGQIGANLYIEGEDLDFSSEYSVLLTRVSDGISMMTCPFVPIKFADIEVVPNVTFSNGIFSVKSSVSGVARLWTTTGMLVSINDINSEYNQIKAPSVAGTYLLEIVLSDGSRKIEKLVVRGE